MSCTKPIPTNDDLLRAEKQVLAGIYGRLLARYIVRFAESYASSLALAVTRHLLSHPSDDKDSAVFMESNRDQVMQEIVALREDREIRRIATDMLVMKVVNRHKKGGCKSEEAASPITHLKELGIYLEGKEAPTPSVFIRMASRFFSETPLRAPSPATPA